MRRRFRFMSRPLDQANMARLREANQLAANGQAREAALLFARLAQVMEQSKHPRRAAFLHARAAHAFADSQLENEALVQARAALDLFLRQQMLPRSATFYGNMQRKLTAQGMGEAAKQLEQEFGRRIGEIPAGAPANQPARNALLPTNCPQCGGPLLGKEARWVDARTVECDYCGNYVRAGE
jgi:hypothetical protein